MALQMKFLKKYFTHAEQFNNEALQGLALSYGKILTFSNQKIIKEVKHQL